MLANCLFVFIFCLSVLFLAHCGSIYRLYLQCLCLVLRERHPEMETRGSLAREPEGLEFYGQNQNAGCGGHDPEAGFRDCLTLAAQHKPRTRVWYALGTVLEECTLHTVGGGYQCL